MAYEVKPLIELSELKIGSYLLYKGEIVHVTSLSLDIDDEYEDTIGFCKAGETTNEIAAWSRALANDLERIPLTEDWIIKFRLHFNYGYEFAGIFNLFIERGEPRCQVCIEQYSEGREPLPDIKYVHQLQILFTALTGKELKVIEL
jgi:hypothetical protein